MLERIEKFCKDKEMSAARFGTLAVRDPRFVYDLRAGREPRKATCARVERFMDAYDTAWENDK